MRVAELQHAAGREQQRITSVQDGQHPLAAGADDESLAADVPLMWLAAASGGRAGHCSSAAGVMVVVIHCAAWFAE
jgi:hypothetical protein